MAANGPCTDSDRSHTFVLRLWFETAGDGSGEGEWRGEIRDVATRTRVTFRRLEGLTAAVRQLGLEGG